MGKFILFLLLAAFFLSCNRNSDPKVENSAVVKVVNGMGKIDTVRYTCDSCEKYIRTPALLNKIIDQASKEAKESLKNPLSFIPRSIKMRVVPKDSFYYYKSNKHVDSCILAAVDYKCIGKNAYGTENEVTSTSLLFFIGDSLHNNFIDEIRLSPLQLANEGRTVDHSLSLYDIEGEGNFSILPTVTKPYSLILTTSQSCVDKGSRLYITFEDGSQITLTNWNEFNCKGTAYFNLTPEIIEQLGSKRLKDISFYDDEHQFASVKENESEYFIQYVGLIKDRK